MHSNYLFRPQGWMEYVSLYLAVFWKEEGDGRQFTVCLECGRRPPTLVERTKEYRYRYCDLKCTSRRGRSCECSKKWTIYVLQLQRPYPSEPGLAYIKKTFKKHLKNP